jgi:hypothetical protein
MQTHARWSALAFVLLLMIGAVATGAVAQGQMQQITPAPAPKGPQPPRPPPSLDARPAVPSAEEENRHLRDRVAKQDAEIRNLTAELNRYKALATNQGEQINQLKKQISDMTRKGGQLVRAYCETETMSRNTAGAATNCAATGFRCEAVSGLCRTRCMRSDECASGFVCDSNRNVCVDVR